MKVPIGPFSFSIKTICALPSAGPAGAGWSFSVLTSNLTLSSPQESGKVVAQACPAQARDTQRKNALRLGFIGILLNI
jgi:hypothetical protein